MRPPREEFAAAIKRWEGEYQDSRNDSGNLILPDGRVVGTMRGVTPRVLAAHRKIPLASLTPELMRSVTLDEAAEIYEARYFVGPHLNLLPWAPSTAIAADFGWGSGPATAIRAQQRLAGTKVDGLIGPGTVAAVRAWLGTLGHARACAAWKAYRDSFYRECVRLRPANQKFLTGWLNRSKWFSPDNAEWWAAQQPLPPVSAVASAIETVPAPPVTPVAVPDYPPPRTWLEELGDAIYHVEEMAFAAVITSLPFVGPSLSALIALSQELRRD